MAKAKKPAPPPPPAAGPASAKPQGARKPVLARKERGSAREPVWDPFEKAPGALNKAPVELSCPHCKRAFSGGRAALLQHVASKHKAPDLRKPGGSPALEKGLASAILRQTTREASVDEVVAMRLRQVRSTQAYAQALGAVRPGTRATGAHATTREDDKRFRRTLAERRKDKGPTKGAAKGRRGR